MALALVQRGTSGALVCFASPMPDKNGKRDTDTPSGVPAAMLAALGPRPCVVGLNPYATETWQEILAWAEAKVGHPLWLAALVGFSAGCQRVRALWLAGAPAFGLVLCDGMHGDDPPKAWQKDFAKGIVAAARAGRCTTVITHSYIHTEPAYTSTRAMAELATGLTLLPEPPEHEIRVHREVPGGSGDGWSGHLAVYSAGGHDKAGHIYQAQHVLPEACRELADLLALDAAPRTDPGGGAPPAPPPGGAERARSAPAPAGGAPIVLVGDSFAEGLMPGLHRRAAAAGLRFSSHFVRGATIADWLGARLAPVLAELVRAAAAVGPPRVLVSLGTNDTQAGAASARVQTEAGRRGGELMDRILAHGGAQVLWILPPGLPQPIPDFRVPLKAEVAWRAPRARAFDSATLNLPRASPTNIHSTPAGYDTWAAAIADWVPFAQPAAAPLEPAPLSATPGEPSGTTLGERALAVTRRELDAGVKEEPPGSNWGPGIAKYGGSKGSDWCAWGFCWAGREALLPGEHLPHNYTGRVANVVRSGKFHARGDGYSAKVGDGAVWGRNGQNPLHGGSGHIGRVSMPPDASGKFTTIEANSGNAWAERTHREDEPTFLGWLEYPPGGARRAEAPVHAPTQAHVALRERFFVAGGFGEMGLDEYVACVLTGELGTSRRLDALKALAVAARTYVVRALGADPTLGTAAHPVENSQHFQVAVHPPSALATRAAVETHGGLALWKGDLILANHVAGAVWAPGAWRGVVSAKYPSEKYVTYNEGLSGAAVHPCPPPIANPRSPRNRGCLSQNGADALATRGWRWNRILRYFYGADLEVTLPEPEGPSVPRAPNPEEATSSGSMAGPLLTVAALYGAYRLYGGLA